MAVKLCSNCRYEDSQKCPHFYKNPNLTPSSGCSLHEFTNPAVGK